jgi:hypothetical protein
MDVSYLRNEIEHMRRQTLRQRKEIRVGLCTERDRQVGEQRKRYPGTNKVINGPVDRRFR